MKIQSCILTPLLAVAIQSLAAESRPADPLGDALFPPELILHHQYDIGLSDEQREAIMSQVQQAHERFADLQQQLQKEAEALGALLKKKRVNEDAALAQFDKVQAGEREIKRAHLALVIGLKNKLTATQQGKLREFKKQLAAHGGAPPVFPPESLRLKMEKVHAGVEAWQNSGRDPSAIGEIMQEFEPVMRQGKVREAEAVLDRALKALGKAD
ncbi:MAG TPA: hypothetical protein VI454_08250 [Verrucomicrobiae bacterium]